MHDDLYHPCTFAWDKISRSFFSAQENGTTLKLVPFYSFRNGLLYDILFAKFRRGDRFIKIPSVRASQKEQNGANFSFIAPSSEKLWVPIHGLHVPMTERTDPY